MKILFPSAVLVALCLCAAECGIVNDAVQGQPILRLKGGTGQGGPSRGFRSNGKSFKWRHPLTMFARAHAHHRKHSPEKRQLAPKLRVIQREGENATTTRFVNLHNYNSARTNEKKLAQIREIRARQKRTHQPWHLKFTSRGRAWFVKALKDDAFRLGLGAEIIGFKNVSYSVKKNMKLPKEFKGRPYDFTNRYIGGPRQA